MISILIWCCLLDLKSRIGYFSNLSGRKLDAMVDNTFFRNIFVTVVRRCRLHLDKAASKKYYQPLLRLVFKFE